jgi:hypothetical protein
MKSLILSIILFLITFSYTGSIDTTKIKKDKFQQLTLLAISKKQETEKSTEKSIEKISTKEKSKSVDMEKQIDYQNSKLDSIIQKMRK